MRLEECPVKSALEVIGGKWKPLILYELKNGVCRFGELRRRVPGCTQKVLTEQLRQFEACGIIERKEGPQQTEYCLSEYGMILRPVLSALAKWGMAHRARLAE